MILYVYCTLVCFAYFHLLFFLFFSPEQNIHFSIQRAFSAIFFSLLLCQIRSFSQPDFSSDFFFMIYWQHYLACDFLYYLDQFLQKCCLASYSPSMFVYFLFPKYNYSQLFLLNCTQYSFFLIYVLCFC